MVNARLTGVLGLLAGLLCAPMASAQQTGAIAGVVRDTSGGALPGVTVEAASPALIEKVRTVVTDGEGRYNIVDLRPGVYTVTFTLPGFSTFRREGIELSAGFTANVNGDMQVGALEETITVSGAAPLVDTANVRKQTIVSDEMLDALPSATKHFNMLINVTPGFSGANSVSGQYQGVSGTTFHGKSGTRLQFDGMGIQHTNGSTGYNMNSTTVEEMVLQTSGISAEGKADGAVMNMIPKEGSNSFRGELQGVYTNKDMSADNLTDELKAKGLAQGSGIKRIYDAAFTLGGPIVRDKLWFFTSQREWGNAHELAGVYWNKTNGTPFYTPDLDKPADRYQWYESHAFRGTWQANSKNKINLFADFSTTCQCRSTGTIGAAPEAAQAYHMKPAGLRQVTWNSPVTSKLLLEAAYSYTVFNWPNFYPPGVTADGFNVSILEQTGIAGVVPGNFRYNSRQSFAWLRQSDTPGQRFAASYVTGSHAFKFGIQNEQAIANISTDVLQDVNYTFRAGIPSSITLWGTPYTERVRAKADMGIFAQDQWTVSRLTLNLGVRYDWVNWYVAKQDVAAGRFLPARSYDKVENVPNWTDLNPRLGASYDLFGNGRTALKVSLGRYTGILNTAIADANNPIRTSVNSTNRSWNDRTTFPAGDPRNGNYVPDCDLKNPVANGECGALANSAFGQLNIRSRWDPDLIEGYGNRNYNWDMSTEVSHQLTNAISVNTGYYRSWYGNFRVTDNELVTPTDFNPYCVTAPSDARLPGGGGYQVCGLYDISPTKFGQVNDLITKAKNFGEQKQVNNFVNASVSTRFGSGIQFGGGIDAGTTETDSCFVVDSPQQSSFALTGVIASACNVKTTWGGNAQLKLNGSYPMPFGFVVSGLFQSVPGPLYDANFAFPTASVASSLGRPLAGSVANVTVNLIEPGKSREPRQNRLDVRLTRHTKLGRLGVQANLDLYNVFNASAILQTNSAFGPTFRQPTEIMEPRVVQLSARLTF